MMQLYWKTGDVGDAWWTKWQTRVTKRLSTATANDTDVHAYCVFGAGHPSSASERKWVKSIQTKFKKVNFHFTAIDQL